MSQLYFVDTTQEHTAPLKGAPIYSSSSWPQDNRSVLVVDDDRDIRFLMRFILEELGYSVIEASDGREGLRALRASGTKRLIVLVDYRMPRMDGWEFLRAVNADTALAGRHTFALVSANTEMLPAPFRALLEEQAIPILAKPFHLDDLDAIVQQCEARAAAADDANPI